MRLYHHSARCPVALRTFLDCNPQYWCFVPLSWQDAINENITAVPRAPRTGGGGRGGGGGGGGAGGSHQSTASSSATTTDPEEVSIVAMGTIDNDRVDNFMEYIPLAQGGYAFSYRQRREQRAFFEKLVAFSTRQLPYDPIDLYQVAIVAVRK